MDGGERSKTKWGAMGAFEHSRRYRDAQSRVVWSEDALFLTQALAGGPTVRYPVDATGTIAIKWEEDFATI